MAIGGITYTVERPNFLSNIPQTFTAGKQLTMGSIRKFADKHEGPLYGNPDIEVMAFINTV